MQSYHEEHDAGEKLVDAYRTAMQAVLTSRNFIYLVEGEPTTRERLTDFELASRLSYFLWSSMPDEEFKAAPSTTDFQAVDSSETDKMSVVLSQEVDRMLVDPKINRFIEDFSRQWLQPHRVGMFHPTKTLPRIRRLAREEYAGRTDRILP